PPTATPFPYTTLFRSRATSPLPRECSTTEPHGHSELLCTQKVKRLLERVKGIEPSSSAWKAVALPLSYTREERFTCRTPVLALTDRKSTRLNSSHVKI